MLTQHCYLRNIPFRSRQHLCLLFYLLCIALKKKEENNRFEIWGIDLVQQTTPWAQSISHLFVKSGFIGTHTAHAPSCMYYLWPCLHYLTEELRSCEGNYKAWNIYSLDIYRKSLPTTVRVPIPAISTTAIYHFLGNFIVSFFSYFCKKCHTYISC